MIDKDVRILLACVGLGWAWFVSISALVTVSSFSDITAFGMFCVSLIAAPGLVAVIVAAINPGDEGSTK